MPRVPYNPAPSVEPTTPGEQLRMQTPPAAFGANIAAALEHLGTTTEHVGDELWNRAVAMQQLNNENEARDLQTQHAQQTAPIVADFDALEGKAARDQLMPHLKNLQKVRESLAENASNPAVKRAFLNDTAGFMQRETFSAARHAGDEYRKYTLGNIQASQSLNLEGLRQFPEKDADLTDTIAKNRELVKQAAAIRGVPEGSPVYELMQKQQDSKAYAHRILGINEKDPIRAAQMLDANRDNLDDQDYALVESRVKSQSRSLAAVNIANEAMDWGKGEEGVSPPKTMDQVMERAKEQAKAAFPDDPIVAQHAATTVRSQLTMMNWERKQQNISDKQSVEKAILDGNVQDIKQLKSVPGMQETIARLGPKYENDLPNRIHSINVARTRETNEAAYLHIQGLYNSDREEFLNTDLTKEHLSYHDMRFWIQKQADAKEKAQADPRVNGAMSILQDKFGSTLRDMGVNPADKKNLKSNYNYFVGALQQALEQHQQDTGKPAKYDDIIGPIWKQLQTKTTTEGWLWNSMDYAYKKFKSPLPTEVPPEYSDNLLAKISKAGGITPTENQIYQAYLRDVFKAVMQGKPTEPKSSGAVTP